ncbi:MAG TPA: alkaline phosphatase D family protein, partial [Polyangiaceae bacterium]|nr:alkaline phosphatase D family protein [Polyangiaceae bacterium]
FMTLSRRRFLGHGARLSLSAFIPACSDEGGGASCCTGSASTFEHGVASGDPLADAVILWTRVTPPDTAVEQLSSIDVEWRVASDPEMTRVIATGSAPTDAESDYTVKVDVGGLQPGTTYYYDFAALAVRSRVGRTKTLPSGEAERARLAVVSCANFPAGFFTVYRAIAARLDLDLVLHLGDYLYEYANATFGDGTAIDRLPEPDRELVTLEDYRARHAQYKRDADLQELHRQHPLLAIWDDHEIANNGFRDGAGNHQPDSEGDWLVRKQSAMRAYFEWMPIRPASPGDEQRIYRQFAYGDLFDLLMLDTRYAGRDARIGTNCDRVGIDDPARSMLGAEQEVWLLDGLRASHARGAGWRLVAQQVMMGQLSDVARGCVTHPDQWDGYAPSRARVLALLRDEAIDNVVVLTGDAHSSWAFDLAENPFDAEAYDGATGQGSLAVEFVTPSVSSPASFVGDGEGPATHPHLKYMDLVRHGYVLVDVTRESVQAEWYHVSSVLEPRADEALGASFRVLAGQNCLVPAETATEAKATAAAPAP